MQKATKVFLYAAMLSLACLLGGLLLSVLDRDFPSNQPFSFNQVEVWGGQQEGLTLLRIGLLGFLVSSLTCLVLTIIQKIRSRNSSA
jgi:hypothetical protein